MNGSLVSSIIDIRPDYPILYRTEIFWNKIACIYITRYDFQNDSTLKVLPINVSWKKYKIVDSENEAKQNWHELNRASSIIKL